MATRSPSDSTQSPSEKLPRLSKSRTPGSAVRRGGSIRDRAVPELTGASLERREIPSFSDDREARIAEAAYWRAERRGFSPGQELDDWLEAEREIDRRLKERETKSLLEQPGGVRG